MQLDKDDVDTSCTDDFQVDNGYIYCHLSPQFEFGFEFNISLFLRPLLKQAYEYRADSSSEKRLVRRLQQDH